MRALIYTFRMLRQREDSMDGEVAAGRRAPWRDRAALKAVGGDVELRHVPPQDKDSEGGGKSGKGGMIKIILGAVLLAAPFALAETFGLPGTSYQALRRGGLTGEGPCGAIAAGMLVHVGSQMLTKDLVLDIAAHKGKWNMAALFFAVYLGFGAMAVIGKWL
jgi:hypothetical protein